MSSKAGRSSSSGSSPDRSWRAQAGATGFTRRPALSGKGSSSRRPGRRSHTWDPPPCSRSSARWSAGGLVGVADRVSAVPSQQPRLYERRDRPGTGLPSPRQRAHRSAAARPSSSPPRARRRGLLAEIRSVASTTVESTSRPQFGGVAPCLPLSREGSGRRRRGRDRWFATQAVVWRATSDSSSRRRTATGPVPREMAGPPCTPSSRPLLSDHFSNRRRVESVLSGNVLAVALRDEHCVRLARWLRARPRRRRAADLVPSVSWFSPPVAERSDAEVSNGLFAARAIRAELARL
jgi:hypothetical protein